MRDFINYFLIYPFSDTSDYLIMALGVFFWIVTILILSGIVYYILHLIDSYGLDDQVGMSMITDKEFIPEHFETSLRYDNITNTYIPTTYTCSDEYNILFKMRDRYFKKQVTEYEYNRYSTGNVVEVMYTRSRLWNTLYIITF